MIFRSKIALPLFFTASMLFALAPVRAEDVARSKNEAELTTPQSGEKPSPDSQAPTRLDAVSSNLEKPNKTGSQNSAPLSEIKNPVPELPPNAMDPTPAKQSAPLQKTGQINSNPTSSIPIAKEQPSVLRQKIDTIYYLALVSIGVSVASVLVSVFLINRLRELLFRLGKTELEIDRLKNDFASQQDSKTVPEERYLVEKSSEKLNSTIPEQTKNSAYALEGVGIAKHESEKEKQEPPAYPKDYISAEAALEAARKKMPIIFNQAFDLLEKGLLPLAGWGGDQRVLILPKEAATQKWFFIGDIHGDFLALHRLLERIRKEKDFRICFLGDLIDRGPYDLECFALILETAIANPDRLMWIAGNHDTALAFNRETAKFESSVDPAEIVNFLNAPPKRIDAETTAKWGKLFIEIVKELPRAALFPDGLLATHGGIPLPDRWENLKNLADLDTPECQNDFTWTRASAMPAKKGWQYDPAKRKTSSAFEFGYRDLEGFCKCVGKFFPVKRVVRGHDHVQNAWDVPKEYKVIPILTLNGFGFHYLSGSFTKYAPKLVLGTYLKNQLPEREFIEYFASEHNACLPNSNPQNI